MVWTGGGRGRVRRPVAALLAAVAIAPLTGCGLFGGGAEQAAGTFLDALTAGDVPAAAAATDDPAAAAELLGYRTALEPVAVRADGLRVEEQGTVGTASFTLSWDFGAGRSWTYDTRAGLRETAEGWRVDWTPSVLHPELDPGERLRLDTLDVEVPAVLAADGAELLAPQRVVTLLLDPAAADREVAGALAGQLREVDPTITERSILDGVAATPEGQRYRVVTLRGPDHDRIGAALADLPGVGTVEDTRLLSADPGLSSPLLAGLAEAATEESEADAGWRIAAVAPDGGTRVLHDAAPPAAQPLVTSVDMDVQRAAQAALAPLEQQAMIVAVRPSTGDVLAVAQTPAADREGAPALVGRYPPGSTFKIVTTAAALRAGAAAADSVLPCPYTENVQGRQITNDGFALGDVPLHTAFANSCNTTMARLAVDLPPDGLAEVAAQLGLGVDHVVPGTTTITGSVPPAPRPEQRVEWSIGQGEVLASPFGMALVAAAVARGQAVTPVLLPGRETTSDREPAPLPPDVVADLRAMMRETVTDGSATALADLPGVAGKTGTAQFGDGSRSHGWFVATAGDLAVAALVVDGGSSAPAVQATRRFLEPLLG
ncbi:penicillin-binding transpeptidase domain-containing protein [Pseudonocardia humida]|uniref:Penicillin-binding protein n=1 Tax=Pseudonocardia humida TaxID=2800819 RepID=A0ABT1A0N6_9PSEU|nr:penicillin-binding transpeptidase domain-containing protein [Pseudonocardia humida]MCO1656374.1 penicillin-binding protein [Pseudonocardia humida]